MILKKDNLKFGLILGLLGPIVGLMVVYLVSYRSFSFVEFFNFFITHNKRITSIIAFSSVLLFSYCREIFAKRIRGNGNITTQTHSAGQFSSIDVSGSIDVYVRQDSSSSIKVEADENLQQYIETIDDGGVLRIKTEEGYNPRPSRPIKVYVSLAVFKKFEASGACDIFSETKISNSSAIDFDISGSCNVTMDVNAPKISTGMSGAWPLKLKGETKDFRVHRSGCTALN